MMSKGSNNVPCGRFKLAQDGQIARVEHRGKAMLEHVAYAVARGGDESDPAAKLFREQVEGDIRVAQTARLAKEIIVLLQEIKRDCDCHPVYPYARPCWSCRTEELLGKVDK